MLLGNEDEAEVSLDLYQGDRNTQLAVAHNSI